MLTEQTDESVMNHMDGGYTLRNLEWCSKKIDRKKLNSFCGIDN